MTTPPLVALTGPAGSFPRLDHRLRALGLAVRREPLQRFEAPESWAALDEALARLTDYAALVVTSPRAAGAVAARSAPGGISRDVAVWAAGAGTTKRLRGLTGTVRSPAPAAARRMGAGCALAAAMLEAGVGSRVLFPCGDRRRGDLPELLRAAGRLVHEVPAYRTLLADDSSARAATAGAAVVVVTSPSVAELVARATATGGGARPLVLALGPTTAAAATLAGLHVETAERPTEAGLVAGVCRLLTIRHRSE